MYVLCFKSNHSISQKNVKISSLQNIFQSFMYLLFLSTPSSFMYFFIQFFNIRFFHFGFFLFIHPKQYKIVWGIFVCIVWDMFLSCSRAVFCSCCWKNDKYLRLKIYLPSYWRDTVIYSCYVFPALKGCPVGVERQYTTSEMSAVDQIFRF